MVETKKTIEQIQNLKPYLPEKTQEELDEILTYWEKIKIEWERKKKSFGQIMIGMILWNYWSIKGWIKRKLRVNINIWIS